MVSGGTIWTLYEVMMLWAYGNGWVSFTTFSANPVWFVVLAFLLPFWQDLHFYWVHRISHWKWLYDNAHYLHHRNTNVGPWSGLSMHPIEHILYLSSALIHLVLPSHPIHILFHMMWNAIGASTSHSGFESLTFRGKPVIALTAFHHQLHHRHLDCNYGNQLVSADRWFDCDHDGSPEAIARVRARQRTRAATRKSTG